MTKHGAIGLMGVVVMMTAGRAAATPALVEPQAPLPSLTMWQAERDFEAVRAELGLSGSAPLVGLEREQPAFVVPERSPHKPAPAARRAARRSAINRSTILP